MAVTTQPRSNRKEAEAFVKELDPTVVQGEYNLYITCDLRYFMSALQHTVQRSRLAMSGLLLLA